MNEETTVNNVYTLGSVAVIEQTSLFPIRSMSINMKIEKKIAEDQIKVNANRHHVCKS